MIVYIIHYCIYNISNCNYTYHISDITFCYYTYLSKTKKYIYKIILNIGLEKSIKAKSHYHVQRAFKMNMYLKPKRCIFLFQKEIKKFRFYERFIRMNKGSTVMFDMCVCV